MRGACPDCGKMLVASTYGGTVVCPRKSGGCGGWFEPEQLIPIKPEEEK